MLSHQHLQAPLREGETGMGKMPVGPVRVKQGDGWVGPKCRGRGPLLLLQYTCSLCPAQGLSLAFLHCGGTPRAGLSLKKSAVSGIRMSLTCSQAGRGRSIVMPTHWVQGLSPHQRFLWPCLAACCKGKHLPLPAAEKPGPLLRFAPPSPGGSFGVKWNHVQCGHF